MKVFEMFRSYNYVAYRLCSKNTVIRIYQGGCPPPFGPSGPENKGGTDNIPDPDLRILVRF